MANVVDPYYLEQGSIDWLQSRVGRATASRFSDVMASIRSGEAASRKNYRAELVVERLTGQPVESYKSPAMEWGNEYEPVARLKYELTTGNNVDECGLFIHNSIMAGASPDGLVNDDGLLEIKCPNTATHIETLRKQEVPRQYYWQVMGQLWITGRKWCDFVSYDPRLSQNAQYFCTRVLRDEDAISDLEDNIVMFLRSVDEEVAFIENYKGV